ncbi:Thioesterase-like superfamily [Teratosphaeria destructans]|uniref:Thioesterase-like superfamily n=1 Tax=Teratosphaeria destructans TaxID=418781 RepID=A0A9W7W4E0_9PEZI|nr:Thioesterase-like superfamily [Teratosphaeria destructans]
MSAAARLPAIATQAGLAALFVTITALPSFRKAIAHVLGPTAARNMWRIAALILAVTNLKNIPLVWHYRVLRGIVYQLYLQPTPMQPKHLFAPMVTSSRNTLYDTDYNLHKSNSTYFADLDVARAHHVTALLRTGLARLKRGDYEGLPSETRGVKGSFAVALGGVSCHFQKQVEPYQAFDIFTRVLSWDRKWLYIVSHMVRKGAVRPDSYVLQPWKKSQRRPGELKKDDEELRKHIFATSVSRYVFKKGRLTINPEIVLERSRLLPPRPAGVGLPPRSEARESDASTPAVAESEGANGDLTSPESVATEVSSRLAEQLDEEQKTGDEEWTWDDMEKERLRGWKVAVHFAKLEAAHNEFRVGDALGEYSDYW